MGAGGEGKRKIHLFCPSLAKLVQFAAWEDQRLDLGSIARAFGLDPTSIKLNGHFIARGVDLIASSVTWRSLLSFFSARGLSTGATDSDPLFVHGNLSKLGSKRMHDSTDSRDEIPNTDHLTSDIHPNKKLFVEDNDLHINKRLPSRDIGFADQMNQPTKKVKLSLGDSGSQGSGKPVLCGESSCCFTSKNMKRMREENLILADFCKRTRL